MTACLPRFLPLFVLLCALHAPISLAADFQEWLADVKREALAKGISPATVESALSIEAPLDKVIELDRKQPEFADTFWNYLDRRVTDWRIEAGQQLLEDHGELFDRIEHEYGIPATLLVAFWGLETNFGRHLGNFNLPVALATLAFDGRRGEFFRRELFDALTILDEGHIRADDMRGSWAGAMGNMQFMPSTFRRYAIDADQDGRKDLWNSVPDALTSAANFLRAIGWRDGETWGQEVRLPADFDYTLLESGGLTGAGWSRAGLTQPDGSPLPDQTKTSRLLLPQGSQGPAFLVQRNFYVIMSWNRSIHYALSVAHLSDRLSGMPALNLGRNADNTRLTREQVAEIQQRLSFVGFNPGGADGVIGSRTRRAIRGYQASKKLPADGHASLGLLEHLKADSVNQTIRGPETGTAPEPEPSDPA